MHKFAHAPNDKELRLRATGHSRTHTGTKVDRLGGLTHCEGFSSPRATTAHGGGAVRRGRVLGFFVHGFRGPPTLVISPMQCDVSARIEGFEKRFMEEGNITQFGLMVMRDASTTTVPMAQKSLKSGARSGRICMGNRVSSEGPNHEADVVYEEGVVALAFQPVVQVAKEVTDGWWWPFF